MRAIELRESGQSVNTIAEMFGLHRGSVSRWFTNYGRSGLEALSARKAPGPTPRLTPEKAIQITDVLSRSAVDYGYETPLWTCRRISDVIKDQFACEMTISAIWKNLRKLNLTCQRPERRAIECNEEEGRRWLRYEWPKIKRYACRWKALLYFQDECGVSLTAALGTTWAPRGRTPVVRVTGKRGSICVSSAVSPTGRLIFRVEKKRVNATVFIGFLKQLLRHHSNRRIVLVIDRAPAHIAMKTQAFIEENRDRLAVFYLPAYSPHLNPDELFNGYLKHHKLKAHQSKTVAELRKRVVNIGRSVQHRPAIVRSFFNKNVT
jgi:transposase